MQKITKAVIPIAGKGTRFLPATKAHPKEMLTLIDKPVIHYIVEEAYRSGIQEILFVTSTEKKAVKEYFTRNKSLEEFLKNRGKYKDIQNINTFSDTISFHYTYQPAPNGSGDALLYAQEFVGKEPFAVFYADDILHCQKKPALAQLMQAYEQMDQDTASLCSVISIPSQDVHKYGIIQGQQQDNGLWHISDIVEKPKENPPTTFASVGRFILNHTIFPLIRKSEPLHDNEIYLATALNLLAHTGTLYGHTITGEWYDCGSKQGLWHANIAMGLNHPDIQHNARTIVRSLQDTL